MDTPLIARQKRCIGITILKESHAFSVAKILFDNKMGVVQYFAMASFPQITPGKKLRVPLVESNRTTGGAFQVWRGEEIVHQGSNYGTIVPDPAPDIWRPIGLVQQQEEDFAIFLYTPTDAAPGEYELRLATTMGSRSGRFIVG